MPQCICWPAYVPPSISATSETITDYTKALQSERSNVKYFFMRQSD